MKKIVLPIVSVLLAVLILPLTALGQEEPISISSFEDLKPYLQEVEVDSRGAKFTLLEWKAGNYVLADDIIIDEDDEFFADYRDHIYYGLFAVTGNFQLDGNGHKITLAKDGTHGLFSIIRPDKPNNFKISNFTLETTGDVKLSPFAFEVQGSIQDSEAKSQISDLKIKVNGNVLPVYIDETNRRISYNASIEKIDLAVGFSVEFVAAQARNIDLHVTGNIGQLSSDLHSEAYVGQSYGFVRGSHETFNEDALNLDSAIAESKDASGAFEGLSKTGSIQDVTVVVDGSVVASGNIGGMASAFADTLHLPVLNPTVHIKQDIQRHVVGGSFPDVNSQLEPGTQEDFAIAFARTITVVDGAKVTIDGALNFTQDSEVIEDFNNVSATAAAGPWQQSLGYITIYTNNNIEVKGGVATKGLTRAFKYLGNFGNNWGSNEMARDWLVYNNHVVMGDINVSAPEGIQFDGISRRMNIADGVNPPSVLVQENMTAQYGDINLSTSGFVSGGLIGRNYGDSGSDSGFAGVGPVKNYKVQAGNIVLNRTKKDSELSSNDMAFSLGASYNYKVLEDVQIDVGDVTIIDHGSAKNFYFGGLANNAASGAVAENAHISAGHINIETDAYNAAYIGGLYGKDNKSTSEDVTVNIDGLTVATADEDSNVKFYVAGGSGYANQNGISNASIFIKDGLSVRNPNIAHVGGVVGVSWGPELHDVALQIGEDLTVNAKQTAYAGGVAGFIKRWNGVGAIDKSTVLIFGDLNVHVDNTTKGRVELGYGLGATRSGEDENPLLYTNSAVYVGGEVNTGERSFVGAISPSIPSKVKVDNFTFLQNKNLTDKKLGPDYIINPGGLFDGAEISNIYYVMVHYADRYAYKIPLDDLGDYEKWNEYWRNPENVKAFFDEENQLGSLKVALRGYQDDYWGAAAERDKFSSSHESDYISHKSMDTLDFISRDANIATDGSAKRVQLDTFYNRHLAVQNNGITYDIFGIPSSLYVIYDGNGNTEGEPPVDNHTYEYLDEVTVLDEGNLRKAIKPQVFDMDGTDVYIDSGRYRTLLFWSMGPAVDENEEEIEKPIFHMLRSGVGRVYPYDIVRIAQNTLFKAEWSLAVFYDAGGAMGASPIDETAYSEGDLVEVKTPQNLEKPGFKFAGWMASFGDQKTIRYLGLNDSDPASFEMPHYDVLLMAMWEPLYPVVYDGNGHTAGNPPVDTTEYLEGHEVTVLNKPDEMIREGYTFTGWNTRQDGSGTTYSGDDVFSMPSENVVLYAQWGKVEEPDESEKPSEPTEPVEPTEPAEPVEPVEPTEPAEPVEPVEPAEEPTEKPATPEQPEIPQKPDEPKTIVPGTGDSFHSGVMMLGLSAIILIAGGALLHRRSA